MSIWLGGGEAWAHRADGKWSDIDRLLDLGACLQVSLLVRAQAEPAGEEGRLVST